MSDDTLHRYADLKQQLDDAHDQIERATGVIESLLATAREQFEVDTVEDMEKLLTQLQRQERQAERKFAQELQRFEERWREQLDESETVPPQTGSRRR